MFISTAYQVGERFRALGDGERSRGRIHSVFDHAVNIEVGQSLYTAIVGTNGSRRSLNITGYDFAQYPLEVGQSCCFKPDAVQIGPLYVDLSTARSWEPQLCQGIRSVPSAQTAAHYLETLTSLSPQAGWHKHIARTFIAGLAHPESAKDSVVSLIGLGPGLTPAGDDIVTGALAAANHLVKDKALSEVIAAAVVNRASKTTAVSSQILLDAVEAEYCEQLDELVFMLANDDKTHIEGGLRQLLSVGASSGCDIASGIAAVLRAQLSQAKPQMVQTGFYVNPN
jgi:hypothetical protein